MGKKAREIVDLDLKELIADLDRAFCAKLKLPFVETGPVKFVLEVNQTISPEGVV